MSTLNKQDVVSVTYEEIGFMPRSFSRVLDRFIKQIFGDVGSLVVAEYTFYRYLFLTTLKSIFILFFVPFFVNFLAKNYVVQPLTEFFWNTKQTEIFLNSYQQKRAFSELKDFEEKLYFESLIYPFNLNMSSERASYLNTQSDVSPSVGNFKLLRKTATNASSASSSPRLLDFFSPNQGLDVSNLGQANGGGGAGEGEAFGGTNNVCAKSRLASTSVKVSQDNLKNVSYKTVPSSSHPFSSRPSSPAGEDGRLETESWINSYDLKSSLFVYQTREADKNIQQRYQEKTIELAQRYNDQSIEAITNFFADLISLLTLFYLLYALEIQINITKSFLLEVFFGLDDSKKSLLILLITDLLVGYHSSNLWELLFEFIFNHYGLPESQTGIFLLVATLPVLLDVLFKYLIFRHLNRSSPATVATYHAMIE